VQSKLQGVPAVLNIHLREVLREDLVGSTGSRSATASRVSLTLAAAPLGAALGFVRHAALRLGVRGPRDALRVAGPTLARLRARLRQHPG